MWIFGSFLRKFRHGLKITIMAYLHHYHRCIEKYKNFKFYKMAGKYLPFKMVITTVRLILWRQSN